MNFRELYQTARETLRPRVLSEYAQAGQVAAALEAGSGKIYTGVCIDAACSVGFCAEHAAIAAMVTAGENKIGKIVAVGEDGHIMPPCGRCREFISLIHPANYGETKVMLSFDKSVLLKDILPYDWKE